MWCIYASVFCLNAFKIRGSIAVEIWWCRFHVGGWTDWRGRPYSVLHKRIYVAWRNVDLCSKDPHAYNVFAWCGNRRQECALIFVSGNPAISKRVHLGLPGYCLLTERMESGPKFSLVLLLGARIAAHPIHRLPNLQGMRQTKRAPKWLPLPTQVWQQRMKRKDENRIVRIKRKTGGIIFQQD